MFSVSETPVIVPLDLADTFTDTFEGAIESLIEILPSLILLLVVLAAGFVIAGRAKSIVERVMIDADADERFQNTALGSYASEDWSISSVIGTTAKWYIILVALLIGAELGDFQEFEGGLEFLVWYVPELLAGIVVILVGLVLAEHAARRTRSAEVTRESQYGNWLVASVKALIIFIAFVIGLEMIGIDLTIVYLIVEGITAAIGLGLAAAIALAIGVAAGFFAKDYVERESESTGE